MGARFDLHNALEALISEIQGAETSTLCSGPLLDKCKGIVLAVSSSAHSSAWSNEEAHRLWILCTRIWVGA